VSGAPTGQGVVALSLNLAGGSRYASPERLVDGQAALLRALAPDLLLLQEAGRDLPLGPGVGARLRALPQDHDPCAAAGGPDDVLGRLAEALPEYRFAYSPLLQSQRDSHPQKWQAGLHVAPGRARAQGLALGWRRARCVPLDFWAGVPSEHAEPLELPLPSRPGGRLYRGGRDSEPRWAQALRLRVEHYDLVICNLHLSTLGGERAGSAEVDAEAQGLRRLQIEALLELRAEQELGIAELRESTPALPPAPLWLLGGDLNLSPQQEELSPARGAGLLLGTLGPTRPWNLQTDAFLADPRLCPQLEEERSLRSRIFVSHTAPQGGARRWSAPAPALPPAGQSASALDGSQGEILAGLLREGLDHYPVALRLGGAPGA